MAAAPVTASAREYPRACTRQTIATGDLIMAAWRAVASSWREPTKYQRGIALASTSRWRIIIAAASRLWHISSVASVSRKRGQRKTQFGGGELAAGQTTSTPLTNNSRRTSVSAWRLEELAGEHERASGSQGAWRQRTGGRRSSGIAKGKAATREEKHQRNGGGAATSCRMGMAKALASSWWANENDSVACDSSNHNAGGGIKQRDIF